MAKYETVEGDRGMTKTLLLKGGKWKVSHSKQP